MAKRKASDEAFPPDKDSKDDNLGEKESKFLAKLMERHMRGCNNKGASYETLRVELGIGERVKSQQRAWKTIIEGEYIENLTGKNSLYSAEFQLTERGIAYASTPEYKEYLKDLNVVSLTTEEHQARIVKHLNPKSKKHGQAIIKWLVKYGTLTANELATLQSCKRGTHGFSYALMELKDKGYIVVDTLPSRKVMGKPLGLSDKAFLKPEDRTDPEKINEEDMAKKVEENKGRKRKTQTELKIEEA